ncbi:hypothetical protein JCM10914A_22210 [Paenibacillus sp. JCM 10914]|uniref:hypothetical protein n=1 Tax=Paenibacillus sp. JCM 10914 TaxID=1236974 RepID=UPI0003CCAD6F|nr:hypothetical protein [Paenibacillus sp. JCM 10914]GAE09798.1 hypothetical protein JCM10914_6185 [Paenibacillus sp. JCM 10914]
MDREVTMMKQIKDHSLFVPEFQKLLNSQEFINMNIEEDEGEAVIRLKKSASSEKAEERARFIADSERNCGHSEKVPRSC